MPAAIVRFDDVTVAGYSQPFLRFGGVAVSLQPHGGAALIFATAYIVWRTGVLPKWSAGWRSSACFRCSHLWVGLPGRLQHDRLVGLTGLVMLAIPPVVHIESVGA